jgi:hypothetical protein
MDDVRFDAIVKSFASASSRRSFVRAALGGGAAGLVALLGFRRPVEAKKLCGGVLCKHGCCNDTCCSPQEDMCTDAGRCCPAAQTCGRFCCPPENVGCTQTDLGDGTVELGCLCPEGQFISHNHCVPCHETGKQCSADVECCSGSCCNGFCCPAGQFCSDAGTCVCDSDQVTCGDTCCPSDHVCREGKCVCGDDYLDCDGVCVPKRDENGAFGCCSTADCRSGVCCLAGPNDPNPCDPRVMGCGLSFHRCGGCF